MFKQKPNKHAKKTVHSQQKRKIHNPKKRRESAKRALKFQNLRQNLIEGTYEKKKSPSEKKRLYFENRPSFGEPELIGATHFVPPTHEAWIFNIQKQRVGITPLSNAVFNASTSRPDMIHQVVRWQLNKARAGTTKQLNRREISGTGKKPFAQKGGGRARASTLVSPIHMGGARAHPKKIRDWSFSLPRRFRREALRIALTNKRQAGRLFIVDSLDVPTYKTQEVADILSAWHTKKALLMHGDYESSTNMIYGIRNNQAYNLLPARGANVHDLMRAPIVMLTLQGLRDLEERLNPEEDWKQKVFFAVKPHAVLGLKPLPPKPVLEANAESM